MEEKQLDFNKPFLSVRRFSAPTEVPQFQERRKFNNSVAKIPPLPVYKSELKSGPIRDPGTVPFVWEKSPGRPKDEGKLPIQASKQLPPAPKPPPGRRSHNVGKKILHRDSQNVRDGQSPKQYIQSSARSVSSANKPGSSSDSVEDKGSIVSDNGEETYVDALDSFSRAESFLNCSVSGLSGLDGQDLRSSERFFTDPQARDLMMDRFLPAAKAMASETPQHAARKQPIVHEKSRQPRHVRKAVDRVNHHSYYQHRPVLSPYHALDTGKDNEDDEHSQFENSSVKVCGLLPRLKNSLCLLNPLLGMREQDMGAVSSVRQVPAKSPYLGFHGETRSKHVRSVEQRSGGDSLTSVLPEDNFEKKRQSQIYSRKDSKKLEGSSLYTHLHGNGRYAALIEDVQSIGPQEEGFHKISVKADDPVANGFNSSGKQCINFRDLLASEGAEWEQGSIGPVIEKTVYVDSVQTTKPHISYSSDTKLTPLQKDDKFDDMEKNDVMKEAASVVPALRDTRLLDHTDEKLKPKPESEEPVNLTTVVPNHSKEVVLLSSSGDIQELGPETIIKTDTIDEKIDLESELLVRSSNQENFHGGFPYFPVYPPLPKSPSESWLLRALPAVVSKKSSARSSFGTDVFNRIHVAKSPPTDPKWEMMVRTSKVHQGHLRFSEELLMPIPEN